jgi:hypothetical protein
LNSEDAQRLLDRVGVIQHPCDLDILVFFARHPRVLLASESLARFLGYDLKLIARSLDVMLDAGLLSRTQTPAHAARLYVFTPVATEFADWLASVLEVASTPGGRRILRAALHSSSHRRSGRNQRRQGDNGTVAEQAPRRGQFSWQGAPRGVARQAGAPDVKGAGDNDD